MKTLLFVITAIVCLGPAPASGQPLSGAYTLGGTSPDFATFAEAATALLEQGVAGPVTFNVRAGTYTAGDARVLHLPDAVAGVSAANRITFQPDDATGASRETVILERSIGEGTGDGFVVQIGTDYVTLRNLTIRSARTEGYPIYQGSLVTLRPPSRDADGRLVGITIQGCRVEGSRNADGKHLAINGIVAPGGADFLDILDNEIHNVAQGLYIIRSRDARVENNRLTGMGIWSHLSSVRGTGLNVEASQRPIVRGNVLDYHNAAGAIGLELDNSSDFLVEDNRIVNLSTGGYIGAATGLVVSTFNISPTSGRVMNNFVSVNTPRRVGMRVTGSYKGADDILVAHNTVYMPERGLDSRDLSYAFSLSDDRTRGVRVLNNIFVELSTNTGYTVYIADTTGNTFDYNVLYSLENRLVRTRNLPKTEYADLTTWQDSTGFDLHSVEKLPEIVNPYNDLHLTGASVGDIELAGLPLDEVPFDIDGDARNPAAPYIGADEQSSLAGLVRFIRGQVTEAGTPLASATLRLTGGYERTEQSGADGQYTFRVVAGRDYTVTPELDGYRFTPDSVSFADLDADVEADFDGRRLVSIVGRIDDVTTVTTEPGGNILLRLTATDVAGDTVFVAEARSTHLGNFSFYDLPAGYAYTIRPVAPGFYFDPYPWYTEALTDDVTDVVLRMTVPLVYFTNDSDSEAREGSYDNDNDLYRGRANGQQILPLTENDVFDGFAAVSANGRLLAYVSEVGVPEAGDPGNNLVHLYLDSLDTVSSETFRLTSEPLPRIGRPSFSPDGTRLIFTSGGRLMMINSDGSGLKTLTTDFATSGIEPLWSPAGDWIAYQHWMGNGRSSIWLMRPDGSERRQVVNGGSERSVVLLAWHPDGRRLVFSRSGGGPVSFGIYDVAADTERPMDVPAGMFGPTISWSGSGQLFAFSQSGMHEADDGTGHPDHQVYVADLAADSVRQLTRITNPPGWNLAPAWRPPVPEGEPTYAVSGYVETAGGWPVPGTTVTLHGGETRTATTDSLGHYLFTGLEAGATYTVEAGGDPFYVFDPPVTLEVQREHTFVSMNAEPMELLFVSVRGDTLAEDRLYRRKVDGSGLVPVTGDGVEVWSSALSGDGSIVAYIGVADGVEGAAGIPGLFMGPAAGGAFARVPLPDSVMITPFHPRALSLSPDGRRVALITTVRRTLPNGWVTDLVRFLAVDADGSDLTTLGNFTAPIDPAFSPDGQRIALSVFAPEDTTRQIWLVDAASGHAVPLTAGAHDFSPTWSPDGQQIAFFRLDPEARTASVWTMRSDGLEAAQVLENRTLVIRWSPDGGKLAMQQFDGQVALLDLGSQWVRPTAVKGDQFNWIPHNAFDTPAGTDVTAGTGGLFARFETVTDSGLTTTRPVPAADLGPLPSGLRRLAGAPAQDVSTTATFTGDVDVCVRVSDAARPKIANLRVLHYEGGAWTDRTVSADAPTRTLCARTSSLSPFMLAEAVGTAEISGWVRDHAGRPVPGMRVQLRGDRTEAATTDGDGRYAFAGLPLGGTYTIHLQEEAHTFLPETVRFEALDYAATANFVSPDVISGTATDVDSELPIRFELEPNYPNPFNPTTTIAYTLPASGHVRLAVYDVLGREVGVLLDADRPAGRHEVSFQAGALRSGIYFYRIEAAAFRKTRSMILLK